MTDTGGSASATAIRQPASSDRRRMGPEVASPEPPGPFTVPPTPPGWVRPSPSPPPANSRGTTRRLPRMAEGRATSGQALHLPPHTHQPVDQLGPDPSVPDLLARSPFSRWRRLAGFHGRGDAHARSWSRQHVPVDVESSRPSSGRRPVRRIPDHRTARSQPPIGTFPVQPPRGVEGLGWARPGPTARPTTRRRRRTGQSVP